MHVSHGAWPAALAQPPPRPALLRGRVKEWVEQYRLKIELDDADRVLAEFAHAAWLLADPGVNGLEPVEREHTLLDFADSAIFFRKREIATAVHDDLAVVRFDRREEFNASSKLAIGRLDGEQKEYCERESRTWMAQRKTHRAQIESAVLGALIVWHSP